MDEHEMDTQSDDFEREQVLLSWRVLTLSARLPAAVEAYLAAHASDSERRRLEAARNLEVLTTAVFDADERRRTHARRRPGR